MNERSRSLSVEITVRTLLLAALVVFLGWAAVTVRGALLLVFLGVFLGLVFEGPTRFFMRKTGLSRGLSGTIMVLGSAVLVTILLILLLRPLVGSMRDFLKSLPEQIEQAKASGELGWALDNSAGDDAEQAAQQVADAIPDAISGVLGLTGDLFSAGLAVFTLLFVALFFISDGPKLQGAVASFLPSGESGRVTGLWERITTTISRWAIGVVIIATIAGTVQGGTAWLLGSEYALALGLIAGFLDMIPNIGATLGGFILTLVLLVELGPTQALIMLAVVLIYQQVENNILTPKIQGKATNISAFFVITGVTVFGALLGVVGALMAVPLTASIQIIIGEYTRDRRERYAAEKAASAPTDAPA